MFFHHPLHKFFDLYPTIAHRLAIQYNNYKIFVGSSKARTCRISDTCLYAVKPVLEQLICIDVITIPTAPDDFTKKTRLHELTCYLGDLVASWNIFELVVGIVAVAVEKLSIQGTQPLASLVHQTDKNVRVVLLLEREKPLRAPLGVH